MIDSSPDVSFRVESLSKRHEQAVAGLHRMALPQGFLSELGDRFLARLYRGIGRAPRSGVWIAEGQDGSCLGFLSGTVDAKACYRSVLRSSAPSMFVALLPSLLRPKVWRRSVETLRYPFREHGGSPSAGPSVGGGETHAIEAELLSVAVAPGARGLGVGSALVATFDEALLGWGHAGPYRVVTDAHDERSNAFYRGVGFEAMTEFLHHDHPMRMYRRSPLVANGADDRVAMESGA